MAAAAALGPRPKLRVLCFGDSLTAGYSGMGAVHHPYNVKLEQMLAMAFPDLTIATVEDGVPGALVKFGFKERLEKNHFPPSNPKKKKKDKGEEEKPYDWVIVLGGTNDLGWGVPPEDIFEKLKEIWDIPLRRKCRVLALTVPEAGLEGATRERIDVRRNKLNDLIKGYKRENFHVFDLHAAVPYFSLSESDRGKYWDDHLHLTPEGYDLVGNKVGMGLVSILAAERPRPAKRRRMFRDDYKQFAEEDGDPTSIDQGYVVVRRADLE